ncbi:MAG: NAD-dependent epimerase/dehydratase family protein [Bacilli bacterium]|nr:NAD-dependent epimerase/dehydratase family protein [Bacilli bacterium]MDD4809234.1 NAD-dependent epimerase/dehydratase family protein [Bacilli bacterium]
MKKVLVTGAYGFLGKYVVNELKENNYKVVAFGRNKELLTKLKEQNVDVFVGDFCNQKDIEKACKGIDYVIHVGALSTVWGKRKDFIETNVNGTKNVLKACVKNSVKRFVFVSSPSIYAGSVDRFNINESEYDENNKLNYYIESKILAEKEIAKQKNIETVIIRPRGLFGVGDTSIIPRLIVANKKIGIPLFNDGKNVVDLTCVENVALALRLALESKKAAGNVYNITNEEPSEFKYLLEKLFTDLDHNPKYLNISLKFMLFASKTIERFYKTFHIYKEPTITQYTICTLGFSQTLNIDKAKKDLKYKPKITLEEGIYKYAKDYKEKHK